MTFLSLRAGRDGSAFPSFPSFPQRGIEMAAEKMEELWRGSCP
ncbi:hypothetical protein [Nonomuraea deserti]|nr:hypothetical protein [Nonomuraea deserti]